MRLRAVRHDHSACRKAADSKGKVPMGVMPSDLDNTQIEDLVAQLAGDLQILPGARCPSAYKSPLAVAACGRARMTC